MLGIQYSPMEDFVAHSSRWRVALIISVCVIFVAIGLGLIGAFGDVPGGRRYSQGYIQAVGWLSLTFFGFVAVSQFPLLIKTTEQLRLSANGIRWREWCDDFIPWAEVYKVSTWSSFGHRAIIIHLKNPDRYRGSGLRALMNVINRSYTGGDLFISMNSSDQTFDETFAAIDYFRQREIVGASANSSH